MTTVAEQLTACQQAHARYRSVHGMTRGRDKAAMRTEVEAAKAALDAAEQADPQHLDPAWASFEAAMKGKTPGTLSSFYVFYLASMEEKTQMDPVS